MSSQKRRVVVTGLGVVTPLGNDVSTYWHNLLAGTSGVARIKAFDPSDLPVQIGAEVKDFNPLERLDAKVVKRADRFTQFALWAVMEALSDSGIDLNWEDRERVGVIVGSGMGGIATWEQQHEIFLNRGPRPVSPLLIPMMIPDMAAGQISIIYGLRGPNYCSVSACASGAHATGVAFRHIQTGDADLMITGGSEAPITKFTVAAFANMGALSKRNDEPERASRPFDRKRDGFVIAEGCAIYILEELGHALKRGAKIYCELVGYGATADGYHITAPDPDALGAALAMRRALEDAGLLPEEIDYINAHGTSTPLNDAAEVKAINMVFGEYSPQLAINSTKSMIGHGLGAAGAMEFVATVLSLKEGKLHSTLNFEESDEGVTLDFVKGGTREKKLRAALSNSFGFGGHNCSLCLKAWME